MALLSLNDVYFQIHIRQPPLNIQPVVVVRGLKRQQAAASTNFVGCFLLALSYFSLLPSALNDLTGPSAGRLVQNTYSIPFHSIPHPSGVEKVPLLLPRVRSVSVQGDLLWPFSCFSSGYMRVLFSFDLALI